VKDLVVEVDAKYIKGMVNNPDIQPNAPINRWIAAILLFDFHLRHVPGHSHGPDGLSRRPHAPEDPADQDDYEEWIDNANAFLFEHISSPEPPNTHNSSAAPPVWLEQCNTFGIEALNAPSSFHHFLASSQSSRTSPHAVFTASNAEVAPTQIPRSEKAKAKDLELSRIRETLEDPIGSVARREGKEDEEHTRFMRKVVGFFLENGRLWKKDSRMKHKLVIEEERRLDLLKQAHDELGHKGIFTT